LPHPPDGGEPRPLQVSRRQPLPLRRRARRGPLVLPAAPVLGQASPRVHPGRSQAAVLHPQGLQRPLHRRLRPHLQPPRRVARPAAGGAPPGAGADPVVGVAGRQFFCDRRRVPGGILSMARAWPHTLLLVAPLVLVASCDGSSSGQAGGIDATTVPGDGGADAELVDSAAGAEALPPAPDAAAAEQGLAGVEVDAAPASDADLPPPPQTPASRAPSCCRTSIREPRAR